MTNLVANLQDALGDAYRIEHELTRGEMSRLFLATEASLSRPVVIKLLPPEFASEVSAARFKQEIELAAHLQHPHIVPVLGAGSRNDLLYYILPYVAGESLRHRLNREGRLSVTAAVAILDEVADALAYAHSRGVVHRDIKPENILIEGDHVVLTDFGVARALAEARSGTRLTQTGMAVGTPGYTSPEQAAGERHIDARADIYALGVVGYEMLAGAPPFEGTTAQAVLAAHLTEPPKPVREIRAEIPRHVSDAIQRAMAKAPADRFQAATELRGALTPTPVSAPGRPTRRARWTVAALAVALAAIVGAFVVSRSQPSRALDANVVVVAPFDVLDSQLQLWREGLVDLLSRNFDGAGPLRTVPPTLAVRRFSGRADPISAQALGKRTGARLAVFGTLVRSGKDSVRLTASVLDVASRGVLGEIQLRQVVPSGRAVLPSRGLGLGAGVLPARHRLRHQLHHGPAAGGADDCMGSVGPGLGEPSLFRPGRGRQSRPHSPRQPPRRRRCS